MFRAFLSAQEHWAKSPVCPPMQIPSRVSASDSQCHWWVCGGLSTQSDQLIWEDEFAGAHLSTQSVRLTWRLTLGSVHSKGLTDALKHLPSIIKSWTPVSLPSNSLWSACFPPPAPRKHPSFLWIHGFFLIYSFYVVYKIFCETTFMKSKEILTYYLRA